MKTSPLHVVCAAAVLQLALIGVHAESDAVTLGCGQQAIGSTAGREPHNRGSGSVVYPVEVLQERSFTITTCNPGTDFDSYLSLFNDSQLTQQLDWNDDDCDLDDRHLASTIQTTLSAGTYYAVVEGDASYSEGYFVIQTDCPAINNAGITTAGITIGVVAGMCIVCAFAHRCRARRNRKKVYPTELSTASEPEPEPELVLIQAPATTSRVIMHTPVTTTHGLKVAFTIVSQGKHVQLSSDSEMAAAPVSAATQEHKQQQTAVYPEDARPQPLPSVVG